MSALIRWVAVTFVLSVCCCTSWAETPQDSGIGGWAFLEGDWTLETPEGAKHEFTAELNKSKNAYVVSSKIFQGTWGIDPSSDYPLLAVGYHAGSGYSVAHFKRISDSTVEGSFWFVNREGNRSEHTGRWEKTDYGYSYQIDGNSVWKWHRR